MMYLVNVYRCFCHARAYNGTLHIDGAHATEEDAVRDIAETLETYRSRPSLGGVEYLHTIVVSVDFGGTAIATVAINLEDEAETYQERADADYREEQRHLASLRQPL